MNEEIIKQLARSQGERTHQKNILFAQKIIRENNKQDVAALVVLLSHSNAKIRHDAIKVLYEIGEIAPKLISEYVQTFISLIDTNDNQLQWGLMTAISSVAEEKATEIYPIIPQLIQIADNGSVITNDHLMKTLLAIGKSQPKYQEDMYFLMIERFIISPENQAPKYAEETAQLATKENKHLLINAIQDKLKNITVATKRKRAEKLLQKLIAHR